MGFMFSNVGLRGVILQLKCMQLIGNRELKLSPHFSVGTSRCFSQRDEQLICFPFLRFE